MAAVIGIVAVSIVIIVIDVPPLKREKQTKELWIFSCLLLLGAGLSIAQALKMQIPNPIKWINDSFKFMSSLI